MTVIEGVTVAAVVVGAAAVVWRKFAGSATGEKGSCKACGDDCSCAIKTMRKTKSSGTQN